MTTTLKNHLLTAYYPSLTWVDTDKYKISVIEENWHQNEKGWEFDGIDNYPIKSEACYLSKESCLNHKIWWAWKNNSTEIIVYHAIAPSFIELCRMVGNKYNCHNFGGHTAVSLVLNEEGHLAEIAETEVEQYQHYSAFSSHEADWSFNTQYALSALHSNNPDAAIQLLGLLEYISRDCLDASWHMGHEYYVLNLISSPSTNNYEPRNYGKSEITSHQLKLLVELHKQCGGWWFWEEAIGEVVFQFVN